jgi:hypothetical protein
MNEYLIFSMVYWAIASVVILTVRKGTPLTRRTAARNWAVIFCLLLALGYCLGILVAKFLLAVIVMMLGAFLFMRYNDESRASGE